MYTLKEEELPVQEETITRAELEQAIRLLTGDHDMTPRICDSLDYIKFKHHVSPVALSDDLFQAVMKNRYAEGSVWKDAKGVYYQRNRGQWLSFGYSGNWGHDKPVRPLVKVADGTDTR